MRATQSYPCGIFKPLDFNIFVFLRVFRVRTFVKRDLTVSRWQTNDRHLFKSFYNDIFSGSFKNVNERKHSGGKTVVTSKRTCLYPFSVWCCPFDKV